MRQNKLSKGYTTSVNNFNQVSPTTSIIVDHHAQSEEEIASPSAINLITETSTNQTRTLHKSNILKSGFNAEDVNFLSKLKIICPQGKNRCEIPKTNFPCILCNFTSPFSSKTDRHQSHSHFKQTSIYEAFDIIVVPFKQKKVRTYSHTCKTEWENKIKIRPQQASPKSLEINSLPVLQRHQEKMKEKNVVTVILVSDEKT